MNKFFSRVLYAGVFSLCLGALGSNVQAALVTNGVTYSIHDNSQRPFTGTGTLPILGTLLDPDSIQLLKSAAVGGLLETGGLPAELREISQFDISALRSAQSATLSFRGAPNVSNPFDIDLFTGSGALFLIMDYLS